jgi:DNA gyrase subunit A
MAIVRPDLSQVDPDIKAYIESLEAEIARFRQVKKEPPASAEPPLSSIESDEPPTSINLITATASGYAKRTPRHFFSRQHRGGMGIFDLDTPGNEPPAILALADEDQSLLLISNFGRAFRMTLNLLAESPVRAKGESIVSKLNLSPDECLAAILPVQAQGYVATVSQSGMVRCLRHHVFGEYMKPGTPLYDVKSFGPLASACWTPGDGDLFIATRSGRGIRFSEKLVPPQGCLGIRLGDDDIAVAIAPAYDDSGIFLLAADGKGTIRSMNTFNPNKASGAGGKNAMATDHLVGAINVDNAEDIFIISKLSKLIRFPVADVPVKEGVVQGVNCMVFRADEAVAITASSRPHFL